MPLVIRLAVADGDEATLQIFRADADPCEEEASLWGENRAKCHGKAVPRGHSAIGEGEAPPRQRVCRALSGSLGTQPPLQAAVPGSNPDPTPCSSPPTTLVPSPLGPLLPLAPGRGEATLCPVPTARRIFAPDPLRVHGCTASGGTYTRSPCGFAGNRLLFPRGPALPGAFWLGSNLSPAPPSPALGPGTPMA